jgi:hypothetical protein
MGFRMEAGESPTLNFSESKRKVSKIDLMRSVNSDHEYGLYP